MNAAQQSLADYLKDREAISPIKQTTRDSSLWWGITSATASSLAILSGLNEPVSFIADADANYFRAAQGIVAVFNTVAATSLIAIGRYQTYRDLSDFQRGHDVQAIIDRADFSKKGSLNKAFNWCMHNTHNIVAAVSIPLCLVMMASGVVSERPGEFASGLFLVAAYASRMMPEKYSPAKKSEPKAKPAWLEKAFSAAADTAPGRLVKQVLDQPPLVLSALLMSWRILPAMANAVYEADVPLTGMYAMSLGMLMFLANTTKDGIGRYAGSLLDPQKKDALDITKVLLEGRLFKHFKPSL